LFSVGWIFLFPESPVDFLGNVYVENNSQSDEPPEVAEPDNPKGVKCTNRDKFEPLVG
jgi:hypothetical protein